MRSQHVAAKTSEMYEKQGLDMDEDAVREKLEVRKRKLRVA